MRWIRRRLQTESLWGTAPLGERCQPQTAAFEVHWNIDSHDGAGASGGFGLPP